MKIFDFETNRRKTLTDKRWKIPFFYTKIILEGLKESPKNFKTNKNNSSNTLKIQKTRATLQFLSFYFLVPTTGVFCETYPTKKPNPIGKNPMGFFKKSLRNNPWVIGLKIPVFPKNLKKIRRNRKNFNSKNFRNPWIFNFGFFGKKIPGFWE